MTFNLIGGGSDINAITTTMNQNISELKNQEVSKVIKDEQGTRVVILDKDGLRTTEPGSGIDVYTATDSDLTFNSTRRTFQIIGDPFTTPFSVTSGVNFTATTVTIIHDLGYVPMTENIATVTTNGWASSETGVYPLPYQSMATSGGIRGYAAYVILKKVDDTFITYEVGITGGTNTLAGTIACYIKQITQ